MVVEDLTDAVGEGERNTYSLSGVEDVSSSL